MKGWRKVCDFANGIVYASGNRRKLVIPNHSDIYFEVNTKEVWWRPRPNRAKSTGSNKVKPK